MPPEDRLTTDDLLQRGDDLLDQSKWLIEELDERISPDSSPD